MVIVMGRLKNKENTLLPIIWEGDASKGVLKEFTIDSRTIQHFGNRYSALIELKKYASRWTRTRREISPVVCRKTSTLDTKRIGGSLSIHLAKINRWDFNEALTKLHRLHRESGEERLAPIPSWQHQEWHPSSSSSSTSGVAVERFLVELMKINNKSSTSELVKEQQKERRDPLCSFFTKLLRSDTLQDFFCCSQIVYSWQQSAATDGGCEQHTSQVTFSRWFYTHMRGSSHKFGVRTSHSMRHPHALVLCVWSSSTSPHSSLFCPSSLLSSCLSSWPSTSLSTMWWTNSRCTSANEDLGTLAEYDHLIDHRIPLEVIIVSRANGQ